ncbi:MAG TPA: TolC family protein [Pseudomonadales bacterium]
MTCRTLTLVALLVLALPVLSADLLQVYQLARSNDSQHEAAQARFEADVLAGRLGRVRSLPQLNFSYRWMYNDYDSNQQTLTFDGVSTVSFQQCVDSADPLACLLQGLDGVEIAPLRSTYTSREANLTLTQVLFDPDVSAERQRGNALALKAAAAMTQADRELIMRVVDHYLAVLEAGDQAQLASRQLDSIVAQQQLAEQRFQLGIGRETDVYEAQTAADEQRLAVEAAQTRRRLALLALSGMTGSTLGDVLQVSAAMPVQRLQPQDASHWIALAMARNDAIKIAEAAGQLAQHDMRRHRHSRLPRVLAAANYNERELDGGQAFQPESTTTSIGVEIRLPLYNGGAMSLGKQQAAYREMEARHLLALQKNSVETAIVGQLLLIDHAVNRYQAQQRAVDTSAKSLAITRRAYDQGVGSLAELFRVQHNHYQAQLKLSQARYDYIRRVCELKQQAGSLSLADIRELNAWLVSAADAAH